MEFLRALQWGVGLRIEHVLADVIILAVCLILIYIALKFLFRK